MGRARAYRNWTGRSPSVRTRDCISVRTADASEWLASQNFFSFIVD